MDGQLAALTILDELLGKVPDTFLEQFLRLGLPVHVSNIAAPPKEVEAPPTEETDTEPLSLKVGFDFNGLLYNVHLHVHEGFPQDFGIVLKNMPKSLYYSTKISPKIAMREFFIFITFSDAYIHVLMLCKHFEWIAIKNGFL